MFKITLTTGSVIWTNSLEAVKGTYYEHLIESTIEVD